MIRCWVYVKSYGHINIEVVGFIQISWSLKHSSTFLIDRK